MILSGTDFVLFSIGLAGNWGYDGTQDVYQRNAGANCGCGRGEEAGKKGAFINPRMAEETVRVARPAVGFTTRPNADVVKRLGMFLARDNRTADMIEFDVAVTASSTTEESGTTGGGVKGRAGIRVVSVELGGKTETTAGIARTDERVSHVKFRIPVALPQA